MGEGDDVLAGVGSDELFEEPTVDFCRIPQVDGRGTDSSLTLCWRRQSRANSSLNPNSLLAGNIQGILFAGASEWTIGLGIRS
jgi:hypothetical protein